MTPSFRRRGRQIPGWLPVLAAVLPLVVTLQLRAAPANDNVANAISIVGITNFSVSNAGATAEPGETAHAGEAAANTLWWNWTAPYTGTFRIVTSNSVVAGQPSSQLDTVVAVYSVGPLNNLVDVVSNDDTAYGEFGALWSRVVFRAYAGESFKLVVGSLVNVGTIRLDIGPGGPLLPSWQALNLQNQPVYSTNFLGRVVLLDFWETTCTACIEELSDLLRLQELFAPRGFTLLGLSGDPTVKMVQDYVQLHPFNYPIGMSTPALQISLTGREVSYPTKLIIDPDGRYVATLEGGNNLKYYRSIVEPLVRSDPRVRIRIELLASGIRVAWPSNEINQVLQGSSAPNGGWGDLSAERTILGSELTVTVPRTDPKRFFRLVRR